MHARLAVFALVGSFAASAAVEAAKPAARPSPRVAHLEASVPCDVGDRVPMGFRGHDIRAIAASLESFKKDAYESQADYEARLRSAASTPGTVLPNPRLCFVVDRMQKSTEASFKYDPELGAFIIGSAYFGEKLEVSETDRPRRTFTGTTAMGVQTEVSAYSYDTFGMQVDEAFAPEFRIAADRAREVHRHLGLIAVGSLASPRVVRNDFHSRATLDRPTQSSGTRTYLDGRVHEMILFDRRTGEILGRMSDYGPRLKPVFEAGRRFRPLEINQSLTATHIAMRYATLIRNRIEAPAANRHAARQPKCYAFESDVLGQYVEASLRNNYPDALVENLQSFYRSEAGLAHLNRVFAAINAQQRRKLDAAFAEAEREALAGVAPPRLARRAVAIATGEEPAVEAGVQAFEATQPPHCKI
jgi:hypothetical protein